MIPELGQFALTLALLVAIVQGTVSLAGAARGDSRLMAVARPAGRAQFLLVAFSGAVLLFAAALNAAHALRRPLPFSPLAHRFASR